MTKYRSKGTVDARKVGADGESVVTSTGAQYANPGDYVVNAGDGNVSVVSGEEFAERYEPVSAPAKKAPAKKATTKKATPPPKKSLPKKGTGK